MVPVSALVLLGLLVLLAVVTPFVGVDSRWEGAARRPDRPARPPLPAAVVNDDLSETSSRLT